VKSIVGVMQGRLLPKYKGRYQAHPVDYWKDEFFIANGLGLDCIEFILDFNDLENNPLIKKSGIEEIRNVVKKSGVEVKTICADYFMEAPLHSNDDSIVNESKKVLINLINKSSLLGITDIVIPCVDQSSLYSTMLQNRFLKMIMPVVAIAEEKQINLSLETDLSPQKFSNLLKSCDSSYVTVNYDIGNSASLGFNHIDELEAYGDKITDIHIKDRAKGGGSIVLGKGDADFKSFFMELKEFNYLGPFIMQAYRDEDGVDIFKKQLDWISPFLNL
jgi:L-ribulose-5-phosphate 3-epimerase